MSGACGPCTLCCTVMGVEMAPRPEPRKERYEPCRHCKRGGCAIYDLRPKSCADFKCFWLSTQLWERPLERDMRPDRSHCVLEVNSQQNIICHSRFMTSWKREPMFSWLVMMVERTNVMIYTPDDQAQLLLLDGSTKPMQKIGTNDRNESSYLVMGATK